MGILFRTACAVLLLLPFAMASAAAPQLKWAGCGITKKAFMKELAVDYEKLSGIHIDLQGGGATKGIRKVAAGEIDIGGSCRYQIPGSQREQAALFYPIAWDALVVIVHPSNPVSNITLDQIRGLYLGKITNWKELGGDDAAIKLYVREGKISGVGRALRKLVFADFSQDFVSENRTRSSGPLEKAVEQDPHAIGITGISSARKRNVSFLSLNGQEPTIGSIKRGQYFLYRPLYLVANPSSQNYPAVMQFIDYANSLRGMQVIRDNGVVPYTDALWLVMKQIQQAKRARERGLYRH